MSTTQQLAKELGISQRAVQNRILRLGLKLSKIGNAFILTQKQAELVRNYQPLTFAAKPNEGARK
jgi:hypothetical protein